MSTSKYEQLTAWFGQLPDYLASFIVPDLSDLDIGLAIAQGTEEWTTELAQELDDAVARFNREQQEKREKEAVEKLAAERTEIINQAHNLLQGVRPLPAPEQTVVLTPNIVDAAGKRVTAANDGFQKLTAAKAAPPTEFAKATETALVAIRSATTAAEELTQAVAVELGRRTQVLEELTRSAATVEGGLATDAKPPLVPENQKCLKNLKAFVEKKALQLDTLTKASGTATPEEFRLGGNAVRETIAAIGPLVEAVNSVAANNRKKEEVNKEKAAQEQHAKEIEDLRWGILLPAADQLAVLADNKPAAALAETKRTYDGAFKNLQSAPPTGFEAAKTVATDAYAKLDQAYQLATRAIGDEIVARDDKLKAFHAQGATADGKDARPEPLPGTAEAGELQSARRSYRDLYGQLATAKATATPVDFNKLATQVAEAIRVLTETRRRAADATRQRLLEVARLKGELTIAARNLRPVAGTILGDRGGL
jgi:hypothetical protein